MYMYWYSHVIGIMCGFWFQFENSTEAGVGAHCNKMIMLLTDGGTDNGDEVFKRRNFNRPLKVRPADLSEFTVKNDAGRQLVPGLLYSEI